MMKQYYYQEDGKSLGPYSKEEINEKRLAAGTYVWYTGLDSWVKIENVPELITSIESAKPKSRNYKPIIISIISILAIFILSGTIMSDYRAKNEIRKLSYEDTSVNFSMYVDKFYRDLEVAGIRAVKPTTIIIKFSRMESSKKYKGYNAVSLGYKNNDIIEIYVNPLYWQQSSKAQRYWLMYHELAHDVLNAYHIEAIPKNEGRLMYPYASSYDVREMDLFIEALHDFLIEYASKQI